MTPAPRLFGHTVRFTPPGGERRIVRHFPASTDAVVLAEMRAIVREHGLGDYVIEHEAEVDGQGTSVVRTVAIRKVTEV